MLISSVLDLRVNGSFFRSFQKWFVVLVRGRRRVLYYFVYVFPLLRRFYHDVVKVYGLGGGVVASR